MACYLQGINYPAEEMCWERRVGIGSLSFSSRLLSAPAQRPAWQTLASSVLIEQPILLRLVLRGAGNGLMLMWTITVLSFVSWKIKEKTWCIWLSSLWIYTDGDSDFFQMSETIPKVRKSVTFKCQPNGQHSLKVYVPTCAWLRLRICQIIEIRCPSLMEMTVLISTLRRKVW